MAAEGQGRPAAKCPYPQDGRAGGVSRGQMKEGTTTTTGTTAPELSCTAIECLKKQLPRQTDGRTDGRRG